MITMNFSFKAMDGLIIFHNLNRGWPQLAYSEWLAVADLAFKSFNAQFIDAATLIQEFVLKSSRHQYLGMRLSTSSNAIVLFLIEKTLHNSQAYLFARPLSLQLHQAHKVFFSN